MNDHPDPLGPTQPPAEVGRRVRGARCYAGLSIAGLAALIGLGTQTIKRIETGTRQARPYELWAIAEACAVPRTFFEADLAAMFDPADTVMGILRQIDARLARIESGGGCRFGGG